MSTIRDLLIRLDNIGRALAQSDHALALLGLGSVGLELTVLTPILIYRQSGHC